MKYKHIFGPVPSRRLGVSLGIDLVPYKTCSLNCIYCECGETTNLTTIRDEYVKFTEITDELQDYLSIKRELDYITFSGAGEPLLNSRIGDIVNFLKDNYPEYKIALLTNGIFLSEEKVFEEIKKIDLVIPSLDAGTENTFLKINRPEKSIDFQSYINGLIDFSKKFKNKIWLEVFIVKGVNDSKEELFFLKNIIKKIPHDKIQLNTIDRPPAMEHLSGVNYLRLKEIATLLNENVEIIKNFREKKVFSENSLELVKNCLLRRPLTLEDIKEITKLHLNEINKILDMFKNEGVLEQIKGNRGIFYRLKNEL